MRIVYIYCSLCSLLFFSCGSPGGKTLSGYDYQVINSNKGKKPQEGDYVYYHVTSRAEDRIIKTSRKSKFPQVFEIPDLQKLQSYDSPFLEVLIEMSEGDSIHVIQSIKDLRRVPPEYGNAKYVEYGVTLLQILNQEEYEADRQSQKGQAEIEKQSYRDLEQQAEEMLKSFFEKPLNSRFDGFLTTDSGIMYKIISENENKPFPNNNQHMIDLSYYACMSDGSKIESSFKYGIPYSFVRGADKVMPGWNEVTGYIREGAEAIVFIPSDQAFGDRAFKGNVNIPANEDLYFYMKIEQIKDLQ